MKFNMACRGFTLVEIAVVLVIVGLLLGGFIGSLSSRIENTRYSGTQEELETIKQALIGYAYKNRILPCPGTTGNGAADCANGNTGIIPWVTLGLGSNDAWGNPYEYWVDPNFTVLFNLDTNAGGVINTRNADGLALMPYANNVIAVVFSRGKNGPNAVGVDEGNNINSDNVFVSRPPTYEGAGTAGGVFDDIVIWISEFELKAKMVEAGKLP